MADITEEEYQQYGFTFSGTNFDSLANVAEGMINHATSFYDPVFEFHNLANDLASTKPFIQLRAKAFKKSIALQLNLLVQTGSKSAADMAKNDLASYSVGGTSMSFNGSSMAGLVYGDTGIATSAYELLGRFGLLYRGVDHS